MKSGVKKILVLALLPVLLFVAFSAKAQVNIALYPLEENFNSYNFNPAFLNPQNRFVFSIFPLGGMGIGYNNQEAVRQLVSKFMKGGTTDQDYRDILQSLADRSTFNQSFESTFLSMSYRSKFGNFNFRIKENENFDISTNGTIAKFIFKKGIQQTEVGLSQNLPALILHYREYSLGYSLPSKNHRFSAGIRAKLYFGKSVFSSGLSGSIQNDGNNYLLQATGRALISIPEQNEFNPDGSINNVSLFSGSKVTTYLMNKGNTGFGIDLGFKFEPMPGLSLSASVTDIGKINWNTNLNSKDFVGEYQIKGSTVVSNTDANGNETITKTFDKAIADSINNPFTINYDHSKFSTKMPVSAYAGMKYQINSRLNLNLADRYVILKNMNYNSLSLTADYDLKKGLTVNSGYAIIANSYFNIPLAVLFKREFGQIYLATDNLAAYFLPSISEYAGFSFGMCFYLFRKHEPNETYYKYLPFYKRRKIRTNSKGLIVRDRPLN